MIRLLIACLAGVGLSCGSVATSSPAPASTTQTTEREHQSPITLHYEVNVAPDLTVVEVSVRVERGAARVWVPGRRDFADALVDAGCARGPLPRPTGPRLDMGPMSAGAECTYRVDLRRAALRDRMGAVGADEVLLTPGAWLWRPAVQTSRLSGTVRFAGVPGLFLVTPWERLGPGEFRLTPDAFRGSGFSAFTRRPALEYRRPGVQVQVLRLGPGWALDEGEIRRWTERVVQGVASVMGRFPAERLLLVLAPASRHGVSFGVVRRGGGASVLFLVGRDTDYAELEASWVVWHELSHLLLPSLPAEDAWFFEGLATYYQEVLRARLGLQSPARSWRNLRQGFERGQRDGRPGRSLRVESARMQRDRAYQRVYWTGAAFMLEADLRLRERGSSLDEVLRAGGDQLGVRSAEGMVREWAERAPGAGLLELQERYLESLEFPWNEERWATLGLSVDVLVANEAAAAEPRGLARDIMRPTVR